jgi:PST family polysaccharide transporter
LFVVYAIHCLVVYLLVRRMTGFRWSATNCQLALVFTPLVALVFGAGYLPPLTAAAIGAAVTLPTAFFSLKTLCRLVPLERLPGKVQKVMKLLRLAPLESTAQC